MKPFPKLVGIVATLAALVAAADHALVVSLIGEQAAGLVFAACSFVTLLSHSLTGTGGATQ